MSVNECKENTPYEIENEEVGIEKESKESVSLTNETFNTLAETKTIASTSTTITTEHQTPLPDTNTKFSEKNECDQREGGEKQQKSSNDQEEVTETEHYKWDPEKREWVLKNEAQNAIYSGDASSTKYSVDEKGNHIYTDENGLVFSWDEKDATWVPKIDDNFMAHYQMNYGFIDNTSAGELEKQEREQQEVKRKEDELKSMTDEARAAMNMPERDQCGTSTAGNKRKLSEPPKWFDMDEAHNTKVYVSNLPLDITMDEFAELMGKCGMIMRDQQSQKFKLKLYTEKDGQIKGDGLCDYIKIESVDLALNILDEYNLRGHKIRVQRAKFQMRGEYNPSLKPKRKKKDKEKLQKIKEKLFDWRPDKMRGERTKNEKIVIIKNLFAPEIFEKDVQLILDYQNDLREESSKCGTVRKVVIYDRHPEGVAQINMATPEEADVVIQMMHGRFFGQRQLNAESWDGVTKFKIEESTTDVEKRLSNWEKFLESEESSIENGRKATTNQTTKDTENDENKI